MQELIIKAETEAVKKGVIEFFKAYRGAFCKYLNLELKDQGHLADAGVVIDGEEVTVHQVAQDKGYVLGEAKDAKIPVTIILWKDLPEDALYITTIEKDLTLCIKSEPGIPDVTIGQFISLDDIITNFNSKKVQEAVFASRESKKAQIKQIKKLQKLGKMEKKNVAVEEEAPGVLEIGPEGVEQIPNDSIA